MNDTLKLELPKAVDIIVTENLKSSSNESHDALIASAITVFGMILVAILTTYIQRKQTERIIKSDLEKVRIQVVSDYSMKEKHVWVNDFRKLIAELITTTDPDYNEKLNKYKMLILINQTQLMLSDNVTIESELGGLITNLGIACDSQRLEYTDSQILRIQANITSKTKEIIESKQILNI